MPHRRRSEPPHPRLVSARTVERIDVRALSIPRARPRGPEGAREAPAAAQPQATRRWRDPPKRMQQGREPAPPVKRAPWKWYIPTYFWVGGIAAGAWAAAAVEDLAGERDRDTVRAGRYLALGGVLAGTALLIADLGRPERFLNMLRVVRARSPMSVGSWGLVGFGAHAGAAALLQLAEDVWPASRLARLSQGRSGRVLHALGLPWAMFVGSYTGALLGATSTPSWSRRVMILPSLFAASSLSSGASAVAQVAERTACATSAAREPVRRRLAGIEAVGLAAETVLALLSAARVRSLPSTRRAPPRVRRARAAIVAAGMSAPLLLHLARSPSRHRAASLAAALAIGGSLALRVAVARDGYHSARTPDDTWAVTRGIVHDDDAPACPAAGRSERPRDRAADGVPPPRPAPRVAPRHEVRGRITVVQDDRIRVVDAAGRGYLFIVKPRRASLAALERWRDARTEVLVRYVGVPDAGARAERIAVLRSPRARAPRLACRGARA